MANTLDAIFDRRSIRAYTAEPLTQEELDTLKKVAVASPTARNAQSWHFTFVTDQALLDSFNADLAKVVGRENDESYNVFYHAPLVVFISSDRTSNWGGVDAGIAVQNLALAAHDMGLGSVILGFPRMLLGTEKGDAYRKPFAFPDGYDFTIAISIGHPAMGKEAHPVQDGKVATVG